MRLSRSHLAAAICATTLLAGCGSSTKTITASKPATAQTSSTPGTTSSTSMASVAHGSPGTLGAPRPGKRYTAENHALLQHLAALVGHYLESRGFHNVSVTCTASVSTQSTCKSVGTNSQGTTSSGTLSIEIDPRTGKLRFLPS